jgi:uncharacterized protein
MKKRLYINLPVHDLNRSMEFWKSLGFSFDEKFCDDKAVCLIIEEGSIYAMLLKQEFFQGFTDRPVADAHKTSQVLLAMEVESKEAVDTLVQTAQANGGTTYANAADHGWMYQHSFADPDGHQWELLYMDEVKLAQQTA